jgi:hypothetical protein
MLSETHVTLHTANEFILLNNHYLSLSIEQQYLAGQDHLIIKGSRPLSDMLHSVGLLWMSDWPTQRLYLTTHNTQKRNTSIPPAGFKPKIPAFKWLQPPALDHAATRNG